MSSFFSFGEQKKKKKKKKKKPGSKKKLPPPTSIEEVEEDNYVKKNETLSVDPSIKPSPLSKKEKIARLQRLTKWKVFTKKIPEGECPICLENLNYGKMVVVGLQCDEEEEPHCFHQDCLLPCFKATKNYMKCPHLGCGHSYGVPTGPMPKGYNCGSIRITYAFPGGTQGPEHPNPGSSYGGTSRTAYLPDNKIGLLVLKKLRTAFLRRHTFRIGTSLTNNTPNVVIWNNIHHKTCTSGGHTNFGYPDENYFERVLSELWIKGVK